MANGKQQVSFRFQSDIYEKFKIVAEKNSRSVSKQIEYLVRQCVDDYESKNGKIALYVQQNNNHVNNAEINLSGV